MSFTLKIPVELLPKNTKFKEGEKVEWGKKSLTERTEEELTINLVEELHIIPKDIFKHLRVSLGEMVEEGKTIAERKSFVKTAKFKAPQNSEVRGIDHVTGTITLAIEKTMSVPFALEAAFYKKEDENYLFKVKEGLEVALTTAEDTNFGGYCSYLEQANDITLENCENKVILNQTEDIMDQAKINALGPYAVISYKANYKGLDIPLLLIEKKEDWKNLFAKKYPLCLYLMGTKTVYFYQP